MRRVAALRKDERERIMAPTLSDMARAASRKPTARTVRVARAASNAHGLEPPEFDTELGARCHAVLMSTVDRLIELVRE